MNNTNDLIKKSHDVIAEALDKHPLRATAVCWTAGKDSTLLLWLVRNVCQQKNIDLPPIVLINEGDVFDEIWEFARHLSHLWNFEYQVVQNDDVINKVARLGDSIAVSDLSERNQQELGRLAPTDTQFVFEPESLTGNHLMKTVPLNLYIENQGIQAVMTGIRRDEQESRAKETYFSSRENPTHTRVHPILHFTEKDVWAVTHENNIPYASLYKDGYRSLGAKSTTTKTSNKPAWEQDLENTTERVGRAQDKEHMMQRLRDLGYM